MALPPIITKRDTFPLISPADPAIDLGAVDADVWPAYCRGEGLDWTPPILDGHTPTRFEIRGLTSRELSLARSLADLGAGLESREQQVLGSTAYLGWCVRLGLVSVTGWDSWAFRLESSHGVRCWPDAILDALDAVTAGFLGLAIHRCSTVPLD